MFSAGERNAIGAPARHAGSDRAGSRTAYLTISWVSRSGVTMVRAGARSGSIRSCTNSTTGTAGWPSSQFREAAEPGWPVFNQIRWFLGKFGLVLSQASGCWGNGATEALSTRDSEHINGNRVGLRGAEDLGGGLRAIFTLKEWLQHSERSARLGR